MTAHVDSSLRTPDFFTFGQPGDSPGVSSPDGAHSLPFTPHCAVVSIILCASIGRATRLKTGRPTQGFWRQRASGARASVNHARTPCGNRRFAPEDGSKNRARPDQHFDHHGNPASAGVTLPVGGLAGQGVNPAWLVRRLQASAFAWWTFRLRHPSPSLRSLFRAN